MGAEDVKRQAPNVGRMKLLGAKVVPVESGSRTLKDAMNEALRDWVTNVRPRTTASAAPPVRTRIPSSSPRFRPSSAKRRARRSSAAQGSLPDAAMACVGGGSNAIGLFRGFVRRRPRSRSSASRPPGTASPPSRHAATLTEGRVGVLHGSKSYVLCDDGGQIKEAHSISAGLDYPGVGPEHSWLKESGRATLPLGDGRRGARRRRRSSRGPRASSPRSRRRTRSPASATSRARSRPSTGARSRSCSGSPVAATRISRRCSRTWFPPARRASGGAS